MIFKKILRCIGAAAACVTFAAVGTVLANAVTCGDFEVTGDLDSYSYDSASHTLNITGSGAVTISGTTTQDTILIPATNTSGANITLNGVNIDVSGTINTCAFKIADDYANDVTITLADGSENTLKSGEYCAGLQKNGPSSDSITVGKLTIQGGTSGTGKSLQQATIKAQVSAEASAQA